MLVSNLPRKNMRHSILERTLVGFVLGGLVWAAAGPRVALAETTPLARGGQALVKLAVNAADRTLAEQTAVQELAAYLEKVTGAAFETVDENDLPAGTPAIYVGHTRYAQDRGIDCGALGPEESVLRTAGHNVILTGGRPRGTLYAVYLFLEDTLGCRWYTPWCESVPRLPHCKIPAMDR